MRYLILGVTEALDDNGDPLPVGGPRLRALLAALAVRAGRPAGAAALVDDVWAAGDRPHDAPAALQALVGRLRRVLGRQAVPGTPGGYRLDAAPEDIDLHVFERLARRGSAELAAGDAETAARTLRDALALWRGPLLADLPGSGRAYAARAEAHRLTAVQQRVEADFRRGAREGLVPELRELVARHPYHEPLRAQLVRALRAEGRQADALVAYEEARRALADGLGTGPGPELTALHRELLAPAPVPDPAPPPVPAPASEGRGSPAGPDGRGAPDGPGVRHGTGADPAAPTATGPRARSGPPWPGGRPGAMGRPGPAGYSDISGGPDPTATTGPAGLTAPTVPAATTSSTDPGDPMGSTGPAAPVAPAVPEGPGGAHHVAGTVAPVHGAGTAAGNIRPRLTSFVGRTTELRDIRAELGRARLVTLTGTGGSGKTRLAEEAAAGEGAWLAELAPLDDPAAVPGAVLSALGLRETALLRDAARDGGAVSDDPTDRLVEHLSERSRARPFLLVLDNCEHVVDAAAALAETLLTHCPGLRVLATSREPLGVPGEVVRPVDPLAPDPAHRLFAERARAVRPGFDPEAADGTPQAVAEICRRLDGLPLAIELAAARLRLLTPRQIADRLDDRFRLLTSGSRTVLPRQQTLRAVVDWSWDLLTEDERTLLRQVSVFAGGWDLAAAEAVTARPDTASPGGTGPDTASLLGALVDKSLVLASPDGYGEMRYRLLETIHEYAAERAAETPDVLAAASAAHTACFAALVTRADPQLRSAGQLPWIRRLETDLDNVRAALHRAVVTDPDEAEALRMVLSTGWFWWLRNFRTEGLGWADRAAAMGTDPTDPGDPRYWPRMHLHMLRFFLTAESRPVDDILEDEAFQALVNRVSSAFAALDSPESARFPGLLWPLTAYMRRGHDVDVLAQFDAAVAHTREHGGDWEYGVTLMFRTHMLVDTPQGVDGIEEDLAELRALSHRIGDRYLRAQVTSAAAEAGMMWGKYEESRAAYREALQLAREVGAHAEEPFLLGRLAEISYRTGDLESARRGLDRAEEVARRRHVRDAHAHIGFLRASIALAERRIPEARRFLEEAGSNQVYGSPPPQFTAAAQGMAAYISVFEPSGGPAVGLRGITEALGLAAEAGCPEVYMAYLTEAAGLTLPRLGLDAAAVRVLAAADGWRPPVLRPATEEAELAAALDRLRARLGPQRYAAERARGARMTLADTVAYLTTVNGEAAGGGASGEAAAAEEDAFAGEGAVGEEDASGGEAAGRDAVSGS
ncbi:AfsR/SARP family transcriptional regulator [Streptomyces nitrosporeus]|uniref:AfsR/SARP family transcriptional regulator n=1 Tax=Streptomyces nitrosporeus TaxID=28894 RepID=UPI00399F93CC